MNYSYITHHASVVRSSPLLTDCFLKFLSKFNFKSKASFPSLSSVSCVYQPECVIHYVINDTTVLIYYEILLRLQTGEAITVSVMMGPQVIGVFVDDYQLFCYDAPPPTPFEELEGRAYCFAGVSVCQSIISSRSFSSQRQCTYQKSNLVYRFIIY